MKNIRMYIILFSLLGWLPIAATAQNVVKGTVTLDDVEIEAEYKLIGDYAVLGSGYNACIPQYSEGKVVVPATITFNDDEYEVNEVSNVAFRMCSKITEVVLPENVYGIGNFAFQGCQALTKVTLPSTLVSIGTGAFIDLPNLTIIDLKAETPPYWEYNDVFKFHTGGIGDDATYTYEIQLLVPEGKVDTYRQKLYSDSDLGWTKPEGWGNFTNIDVGAATNAEAYATYHNGTLTFYYDTHRTDRESNGLTTYGIADYGMGGLPAWLTPGSSHANEITQVEFTPLFQYACPETTTKWFSDCVNLNTIIGMNHLRTDEVTDMSFMFNGCSSLNDDDFDFSQFNTASVTNMQGLFYGCTGIQQPDLSHFDTRSCTNMQDMFWGCTGLTSIDLSSFETTACNFNFMFYGCTNLETVSIGSLATESEGICLEMFGNCSKLSTLVIPSSFNKLNKAFNGCTSLYDVYCYKPMPFSEWQGRENDFYTNIPYYTRFHVLESTLEAWETAYGQNSATPANVQFIGDLGTDTNPILIYGTADWMNVGLMTDNDIRVNAKMMNDIRVTTMLGTLQQPFKGVFDGNGHTLTVNYEITGEETANDPAPAPFCIIQNAEIRNLKVEGNITVTATGGRSAAAGLVGQCRKISNLEEVNNTITNCQVSTHVFGNITHLGGIVAFIEDHAATTISGCYFDGSLATPHDYVLHYEANAGAIVCEYVEASAISIVDCVENGSYVDTDTKTFAKQITPINSYYLSSELSGNAKHAYSLTTDTEGLVLDFGTPTATYDVSGITAYGTGLKMDTIFLAGTNQPINVAITAPGYEYSTDNLSISGGADLSTTDQVNYTVTLHNNDAVIHLPGMEFTTIILYDDAQDNTLTLENYIDQAYKVRLAGHTIHKNAQWNMLCLPFDLSGQQLANSPLAGARLKTLDSITFDNKVAVFHFNDTTAISANKLYFVKVTSDIEDPLFNNVTIKRSLPPGLKKKVGELTHSGFVANGNYNKVALGDFDADENLYATLYFDGTSLRNVKENIHLNAFQGYFEVCVSFDSVVAVVLDIDGSRYFKTLRGEHDNIDNIFFINGDWNEYDNWASGSVPSGTNRNVLIEGRATIPGDYRAEIGNIIIDQGNLTIKSGGQLVHTNEGVRAVVEKDIAPYTSDNDGWNFIASPLYYTTTPVQENGFIINTFDLYYLDEANSIWRNYKAHPNFYIDPRKGYLYASSEGTTLQFSGTLQPFVEPGIGIPLNHEGQGWNLVGNPFAFAAYPNKPYYVINGRNVEATESGEAVAPCTGIVVKAESDGPEWVDFTKDAPAQTSAQAGSLHIVLTQANGNRGTNKIDNAIVSFNENEELGKFYFGEQNANIYIPQNGKEYAIATSNGQGEMPLNFKATENGEYTITVHPDNVELVYLHLIDNLTGADIDLLTPAGITPPSGGAGGGHGTYTFTAKTTDYESRFKLVFSAIENADSDADAPFAFVSNGEIIINDADAGNATLQVIDMTGCVVRAVGLSQCGSRTTTTGMTAGVYVLRLIDGDNVKTQKLVIE